uniref:Uncharacterized protein n=2 Tax=unclassified Caudoviricetes TaxID=2788787 RepID=A0A8S5PKH0_9CAUD|nr:MAG TPA: hypothetical protein [Siphoviridae sp. ctJcm18]DAE06668.1 MAG TPA: hypothetical protein [Siphoviridae sp. ctUGQ45]
MCRHFSYSNNKYNTRSCACQDFYKQKGKKK